MFSQNLENLETRDRILAVAMDMFSSKDYSKVTLKGIAEAAGLTKGGIYHYFESKDHLLSEGIQFSFRILTAQMEHQLEPDMSARALIESWFQIEKMMGSYADMLVGDKAAENLLQFMYLMLTAVKKSPKVRILIGSIYKDAIDKVEEIFIKAQESGEIRKDIDARGIAVQMITSFEGTILLGGLADTFSVKELGDILLETLWTQIKS
jgi:AcrR family transcriptional regulator